MDITFVLLVMGVLFISTPFILFSKFSDFRDIVVYYSKGQLQSIIGMFLFGLLLISVCWFV